MEKVRKKTYRVPVTVSVAPVMTYDRSIVVEAESRAAAAQAVRERISEIVNEGKWRARGHLGCYRPELTVYDTYLAEDDLDAWAAAEGPSPA